MTVRINELVFNMGEISTLALNAPGHASLRTTVPMNIIRQWGLGAGDKLEWSWEARDNEMIVVVRKAQREIGKIKTGLGSRHLKTPK
jgi:bifunctional DNA-binding transcriptional regulator/antitoxin component of YhaV-PrlF toxin-antitoxin module